jgi:hypothetical protein
LHPAKWPVNRSDPAKSLVHPAALATVARLIRRIDHDAEIWLVFACRPAADPLHAGSLASNLSVYVPAALESSNRAVDLFTASVVAQGGHYISVIAVLPMLLTRLDPRAKGLLAWPGGPFRYYVWSLPSPAWRCSSTVLPRRGRFTGWRPRFAPGSRYQS